jgi:hypothetical protein
MMFSTLAYRHRMGQLMGCQAFPSDPRQTVGFVGSGRLNVEIHPGEDAEMYFYRDGEPKGKPVVVQGAKLVIPRMRLAVGVPWFIQLSVPGGAQTRVAIDNVTLKIE